MAATFDESLSTDKDKVRALTGDIHVSTSARVKLQDETISAVLTEQTNVNFAAAVCCEIIAASVADETDYKTGELSVAAKARFEHYMAMAKRLRQKGSKPFRAKEYTPARIKVGGALESENDVLRDNTDVVPSTFSRTAHDYPGAWPDGHDDDYC